MNFYLIGMDYKNAPLDVREDVYRKRQHIADFWSGYRSQRVAILATCNRVELYGVSDDIINSKQRIELFYKKFPGFFGYGYATYDKADVFRHSLRLACGLESQLKGENQILQQLDSWRRQDSFPLEFAEFWDRVMTSSRDIRKQVGLDSNNPNIADLILDEFLKNIGRPPPLRIVIIGTGKIAELFAKTISSAVRLSFISNKNRLRAEQLANWSRGSAGSFDELQKALVSADAVISATSSPHFVLDKEDFSNVVAGRDKLLYIYDVAMPRDIDPSIGGLNGVVLKNMDDLAGTFREYNERLSYRLAMAEELIEEHLKEYGRILYGQDFEGRHAIQLVGSKTS